MSDDESKQAVPASKKPTSASSGDAIPRRLAGPDVLQRWSEVTRSLAIKIPSIAFPEPEVLRSMREAVAAAATFKPPALRLAELGVVGAFARLAVPNDLIAARFQIGFSSEVLRKFAEQSSHIGKLAETLASFHVEIAQAARITSAIEGMLKNDAIFRAMASMAQPAVDAINKASLGLQLSTRIAVRNEAEVLRTSYAAVTTAGVIEGAPLDPMFRDEVERGIGIHTPAVEEFRTKIYLQLEARHPALGDKARGAWDAIERRGPDYVSQAANSMLELVDHLLRMEAPDDEASLWCMEHFQKGLDDKGRPTRSARVRYICSKLGRDHRPAEKLASAVTTMVELLQGAKHRLEAPPDEQVKSLFLSVEGFVGYLLF